MSFSLLVCFAGSFLGVKASAAVSNLVPPLLVNWSLQNYEGGDITVQTTGDGVSSLMIGNTGYGFVYKQLNLIQGHKYKFTVKMIQSSFQWPDSSSSGFCTFGFCDSISQNKVWLSYNVFVAGDNNLLQSCEFIAGSSSVYVLIELVTNGHYCSSRLTDISIIDLGSSDTQSVIDNANQNAQDIQDNIDDNTTKIGGWLSELGDKIKSIFVTETFIIPEWQHKRVSNTGEVGMTYMRDSASTTDLFFCSVDNDLYNNFGVRLTCFRYNNSGVFVDRFFVDANSHFILVKDYYYRLFVISPELEEFTADTLSDYCNEYVLISSTVTIFDKLLDGIRSLFVPSVGFFEDFTDDMNVVLEERFGVLFQIGDFLDNVLSAVKDLVESSGSSDFTFTLPAMSFTFLGYNISLWDDITIEFTEVLSDMSWFSLLYSAYGFTVQIFLIAILFSYGDKLFKEVFRS